MFKTKNSAYVVPDFPSLARYGKRHYELTLVAGIKVGNRGRRVMPVNLIPDDIPLPIRDVMNNQEVVVTGDVVDEMEFGKHFICLVKDLPRKTDDGAYWMGIDTALPCRHFALENIVERTIDSWRLAFIKPQMMKLYERYGEYSFMMLSHNFDEANKILNLTPIQKLRLNNEWTSLRAYWHEMRVLLRFGINNFYTHLIADSYRESTTEAMNTHPFRVVQQMQLKPDVQKRFFQATGVISQAHSALEPIMRDFLVARGERDGATALDLEYAARITSRSLYVNQGKVETTLLDMILHNRADYRVMGDGGSVSLGRSIRNDLNIGDSLGARIAPLEDPIPYKDYPGDEKGDGSRFELNQDQKTAIFIALNNKTSIITGGPGTGKTTTAKTLIREVRALGDNGRVFLTAPTGKAAKRMSEVTGLPCFTMHRMLGMVPGTTSMLTGFGDYDTLIMDEMSMVDLSLFSSVVRHIGDRGRLVLLGDSDQLASVESGDVLNDMIQTRRIPVARLLEVQRQAAQSNIVTGSYSVLEGNLPEFGGDLHLVNASTPKEICQRVRELVSHVIPQQFGSAQPNIQILGAMRKGDAGINELNRMLKPIFNPASIKGEVIYRQLGSNYYHAGDRVMYLKNRYERDVQNGEVGTVLSFNEHRQEMVIQMEDRQVVMPYDNYQDITHAWASTVHKSQGSEYDAVIFVMPEDHLSMLTRNLIFTAMTRGKKNVFFVGDTKVMRKAIEREQAPKRRTHLSFSIAEAVDGHSRHPLLNSLVKDIPKAIPKRRREIDVMDIDVPF